MSNAVNSGCCAYAPPLHAIGNALPLGSNLSLRAGVATALHERGLNVGIAAAVETARSAACGAALRR